MLLLPTQLGNCINLLRNKILLRLQSVTQLRNFPFIIIHVVGIVVVEAACQGYGGTGIAFHANLLLHDAIRLGFRQAKLLLEE